jgi:hypothetical protein
MPPAKPTHPIRRVREALKATPKEMGLREYATGAGFAKFLGRSSSAIRNVECGITDKWDNLATVIERKTRVSRRWLLSKPGPEDPILDVRGNLWSPSRELDPLRSRRGMPDWRHLMTTCPGILPDLMAHVVRAQLTLELSLGHSRFIEALVSLLERSHSFENPGLQRAKSEVEKLTEEGNARKTWRADHQDEIDSMMAKLRDGGAEILSLDEMNELLQVLEFGWATKLPNSAGGGIIEEAKRFHDETFPAAKRVRGHDDGELE